MRKGTAGKLHLSEEDLQLLNTPLGLKSLLADKKPNVDKALRLVKSELRFHELQAEVIKLQNWVIEKNKKVVVIFEGRDAAGKGGAIRRITEHINPRHFRIVALPKPTVEEQGQWYFQRYVNQLPKPGEMVFFDRSWYNRAVVEPVNGFCTKSQYQSFMEQVNSFENMIMDSGIYLIKFYFSITKEEQARRFKDIQSSPLKRWKLTPVDRKAQELWDTYTEFKLKMFEHTDLKTSPWIVVEANSKTEARIQVLEYIIDTIPYIQAEKKGEEED
ncbi:polyphosphate kinase 2 [Muriicola soli]|uniref:ADP/GDP-polyphosphate phosphotransferase n=1 Tax=Muriicola soli TaxID=2507538 RepID=A0A411E6H8_9FLAO|nr:polyphosphate kinase 2 [Muriicola soli]QBA63113.1 polyphosphate kinase 2 [Muriicola soli]